MTNNDGGDDQVSAERDFEADRESTRGYLRVLDALKADVSRVVGEELAGREMTSDELGEHVRGAVREELRKRTPEDGVAARLRSALMPAGIVLVVLGALWVLWGLGPVLGLRGSASAVTPVSASDVAEESLAGLNPRSGGEWAMTYDALFGSHEASFTNALLLSALRSRVDSTLILDRDPNVGLSCPGIVCDAVIVYWRTTAGELGYPDLPESPVADSVGLGIVQRLLVLDHLGLR